MEKSSSLTFFFKIKSASEQKVNPKAYNEHIIFLPHYISDSGQAEACLVGCYSYNVIQS